MDRLQACQRLPDAVGSMADVDDRQRVVLDDFESAGPARVAQAGAYRGFDPARGLARLHALQPEQEQGDGNGGVVELERAGQVHFQRSENRNIRTENRNAAPTPLTPRCRCRSRRGRTAACNRASDYIRRDAAAGLGNSRHRRWCRRPRRRRSCRIRSAPANGRAVRHARNRPRSRRFGVRRPGEPDRSGRRCRPRTPRIRIRFPENAGRPAQTALRRRRIVWPSRFEISAMAASIRRFRRANASSPISTPST